MFIVSRFDEKSRQTFEAVDSHKEFLEYIKKHSDSLCEFWHVMCNFGTADLDLILDKRVYEPVCSQDTRQHTVWTAINMAKVGESVTVQCKDWSHTTPMTFTVLSATRFA